MGSPVGLPDQRWGERVVAVIQPRPATTPDLESIQAICRVRLAIYKMPRNLCLVGEIERSSAGKPDYRWARETAARTLSGR